MSQKSYCYREIARSLQDAAHLFNDLAALEGEAHDTERPPAMADDGLELPEVLRVPAIPNFVPNVNVIVAHAAARELTEEAERLGMYDGEPALDAAASRIPEPTTDLEEGWEALKGTLDAAAERIPEPEEDDDADRAAGAELECIKQICVARAAEQSGVNVFELTSGDRAVAADKEMVKRALKELKDTGALRSEGIKRGCRYFATRKDVA